MTTSGETVAPGGPPEMAPEGAPGTALEGALEAGLQETQAVDAIRTGVRDATKNPQAAIHGPISGKVLTDIDDVPDPDAQKRLWHLVYDHAVHISDFPSALYCLGKIRAFEGADTPELAIENAKLHILLSDHESAYHILRDLCEGFPSLNPDQAHEALWYLFKSHRLGSQTITSRDEVQENLQLFLAIQKHFRVQFNDILPIIELGEAFRRGDQERASNEGVAETGFEETIRLGEELGPQENRRVETERLKLVGAAYTVLAGQVHQEHIETREGNKPEKNTALRKKQEELAIKAVASSREALALVSDLPLLDAEAGEPLRLKYNLAKACFLLAVSCPGDYEKFSDAHVAIEETKRAGKAAGNKEVTAFAELVLADLFRYAGGAEGPGRHQLERAIKINEAALETGTQNPIAILAALINIGQIHLQLDQHEKAKEVISAAEKKYFEEGGDEKMARVIEKALRKACLDVGIRMRVPKVRSFTPMV